MDTIYALSSGAPPAAIGVMRVSGPQALAAGEGLCGSLPEARRASLRTLRGPDGEMLDSALVLVFPGPDSATGEDLVEFHLHGGRAVVAAVSRALGQVESLRPAEAGEFTRRAFANGRMDLAEAEGLAELLTAETELQRRVAIDAASGGLSRQVDGWRQDVLVLAAQVEAVLDFDDEDDVGDLPAGFAEGLAQLRSDIDRVLEQPIVERLGEGFRVALAGPPNAGKSTLFNALIQSEAAITAPVAGTTRDVLERNVALDGVPFTFVDMAGLREDAGDEIEAIGVGRAAEEVLRADLVLWLDEDNSPPDNALIIAAKSDLRRDFAADQDVIALSAKTGAGLDALRSRLLSHARESLPKPGAMALNARQRDLLSQAADALARCEGNALDPLLLGEDLRLARLSFDAMTGRSGVEDMLDALFGKFCIGK